MHLYRHIAGIQNIRIAIQNCNLHVQNKRITSINKYDGVAAISLRGTQDKNVKR